MPATAQRARDSRLPDIPVFSREYKRRKDAERIAVVWRPTDDVIDEAKAYYGQQEDDEVSGD